jgi:hypothetical protein
MQDLTVEIITETIPGRGTEYYLFNPTTEVKKQIHPEDLEKEYLKKGFSYMFNNGVTAVYSANLKDVKCHYTLSKIAELEIIETAIIKEYLKGIITKSLYKFKAQEVILKDCLDKEKYSNEAYAVLPPEGKLMFFMGSIRHWCNKNYGRALGSWLLYQDREKNKY